MKNTFMIAFLCLLLTVVLITGCAPGGTSTLDDSPEPAMQETASGGEQETPADTTDTDNITLIQYIQAPDETSPRAVLFREFANQFEANNPGVTVEFRLSPAQDFDMFFKTAVAAGEQIDVVDVNIQFYRDYVRSGFLLDITDRLDLDRINILDMAWEQLHFFSMDDSIYGVPIELGTTGFYYNRAIFQDLGIEYPETWDDMYELRDILAPHGIYTMVYAGAEPWWNPMHFNMIFYQYTNNNGLAVNDLFMSGDFSDEVILPYIQTIQHLADLENDRIFMPGTQGMDHVAAASAFVNGQAATFFMGSWFIETVEEIKPEDFEYGIFPVPILAGSGNVSQTPGSVGSPQSVFSGSQHPDLAMELIHQMVSVENMRVKSAELANFVNIFYGAEGYNPVPAMAYLEAIAPSTVIWLDAIWEPEIISDFQLGVQSAILGNQTPAEVMDDIIAHYQRLREEGRVFIP